jgi:hypothetical protein
MINPKTTYGRKLPHVSNFIQPKCMIKGKEMETFIPAKTNVDLAAKNGMASSALTVKVESLKLLLSA